MPQGREVEIKFTTDAAGLALAMESELLTRRESDDSRTLRSVYYDTAALDLKKQRMVLRVRDGDGAPRMGLKSPPTSDGPFSREEIEVRIATTRPDIRQFDAKVADDIKRRVEDRPLEPQFKTVIKRSIRNIKRGQSEIEVAFDDGEAIAGDRRVPIREIELELKSGEEGALYDLAIELFEHAPLKLEFMSKAERGFLLARGELPAPVKDSSRPLSSGATLDEAAASIIAGAITHFASNWPAFREARDPEAIHQMRVALRRLRSAMAMFNRETPCPRFDALRAEAQRIGLVLGNARDHDIFGELIIETQGRFPDETGFEPLLAALEQRRLAAYGQVQATLDEPATTLFLLRAQEFVARRGWGEAPPRKHPRGEKPARDFARETLERLRQRAMKRGKGLADLPDAERHKLRIALKNLRYAAEFFGGLFASDAAEPYVDALARLQDLLGAHNDEVNAMRLLRDMDETTGARTAKAHGIVLGWHARGKARADAELYKCWRRFKRREMFWR